MNKYTKLIILFFGTLSISFGLPACADVELRNGRPVEGCLCAVADGDVECPRGTYCKTGSPAQCLDDDTASISCSAVTYTLTTWYPEVPCFCDSYNMATQNYDSGDIVCESDKLCKTILLNNSEGVYLDYKCDYPDCYNIGFDRNTPCLCQLSMCPDGYHCAESPLLESVCVKG